MANNIITTVLPIMDGDKLLVTSPFGMRGGVPHRGIDLTLWRGWSALSYIHAAADGEVVYTGYDSSRGYWIKLDHGSGVTTQYYHLIKGSITVERGQTVKAGVVIGNMGSTGNSTGAHLHFQVEVNDVPVDPLPYLLGGAPLIVQAAAESNTAWSDEAVAWAQANGIIYGDGNGNLMLDEPCTRRQMVTFLHRFAQSIGKA